MTTKTPFYNSDSTSLGIQQDRDLDIEIALEEADIAAQMSTRRLTHEEVFSSLLKSINAYQSC